MNIKEKKILAKFVYLKNIITTQTKIYRSSRCKIGLHILRFVYWSEIDGFSLLSKLLDVQDGEDSLAVLDLQLKQARRTETFNYKKRIQQQKKNNNT